MKIKFPTKLIEDNAPTILTTIAVIGTVATGYLSATGALKASKKIRNMEAESTLSTKEKIQMTWLDMTPAVGSAALTITAMICAHKITAGRVAAMAAAYSLSESRLSEYKSKIEEKFGIEKKTEIEDELIHERLRSTPVSDTIILGGDDVLCFDAHSGRYFKSSMDEIRRAVNDTNFEVINQNYATLEFFWDLIGLPPTAYSEEFGWSATCPLHVQFGATIDGRYNPALVVKYDVEPIRRYNHFKD